MIHGRQHSVSAVLRLHGPALSVSPPFRAGETVPVRILGQSGAGRFTVVVRGQTFVASSGLSLVPGSVLSARVERQGAAILLRLAEPPADLAQALAGARLPADGHSQAAARALLSSGLGVSPERLEQMRVAYRGPAEGLHRRLRSAAELLKKLPTLGTEDLDALLRLVQPGSGAEGRDGGRGHQRERRRPDGQGREAVTAGRVREALWGGSAEVGGHPEGPADEPSADRAVQSARAVDLLRLVNHSKGSDEVWVVLPCRMSDGHGREVSGSVRVLYDTVTRAVKTVTLGAGVDGGDEWWFHLSRGAGGLVCRVFRDAPAGVEGLPDPEHAVPAALEALRLQLGNLGVRLADTIGDGASFDGFGIVEPGQPRPVDLVG